MPRLARMIVTGEPAIYHVMSRTVLDGFVLGDIEKEYMLKLIKHLSKIYFSEVLGFCLMGNHFHLLVKMVPENEFSDDDLKMRYESYYGSGKAPTDGQLPMLRQKWSNLSEYVKEIKQTFSRFYNKRHGRRGFFWSERFKSLIVEKGETLINCLAYIDLNPVRAGIVEKPEDYRWNSLGYHIQTGNKDGFLSADFGFNAFKVKSESERVRLYRKYVYETAAIVSEDKPYAKSIDEKVVAKARKIDFEVSRADRFLYRTRYFTDSGIIGSREYVSATYQQFKHLFQSKHEKKPKPVKGLVGMFSLKRLYETI
jgi:putative transposase